MLERSEFRGPGALGRLVLAALRLDPAVYGRVASTADATHICLAVAAVSGVARALTIVVSAGDEGRRTFGLVLLVCVGAALLGALIDASFVWLVARTALRRSIGFGAVLRPIALAAAPSLLRLLEGLGERWVLPVAAAAQIWVVLAIAVGIRAALGASWPVAGALTLCTALFQVGLGQLLG